MPEHIESFDIFSSSKASHTTTDLPEILRLSSTPARLTSEFFGSLTNLDPVKFSPPDTNRRIQTSPMSEIHTGYSPMAELNPWGDDRYTRIGDFYQQQTPDRNIGKSNKPLTFKLGHKPSGMLNSKSDGHIMFRSNMRDAQDIRDGMASAGRGERSSEDTLNGDASSSFSRGRTVTRTPSPIKMLEDIEEVRSPVVAKTPSPRKRSGSPMKKLFGEGGWLGKSTSMRELPSQEYRKKGFKHWGEKVKERVENLTEDVSKYIPGPVSLHSSPSKSPARKSKFHVSLSPPMQAKLYSELELMICATANQYLNVQKDEGRMSVESVTKIMQFWHNKNRPQVIEFMFDQATQRDLVLYNLKTFRFYGPNADNIVSMNSMMQSWKALAREMSVRTFCTPDSVVKKHMLDCYKILEMLGAPLVTFLAFQEIQVKAMKIIKEEQQKKKEYEAIQFGVERRWEVPGRETKERRELENPFA